MDVREGVLRGGLPYLRVGAGPVLAVLVGLEPRNEVPTGFARGLELRQVRELAEHFTVYSIHRRPGLPPGCTMADIAAEHATALEAEFGEPVHVQGVSTGGAVALQLVRDHPERVRRLVLLAGACRLSDRGRAVQREIAARIRAGDRRAWAPLGPALAGGRATAPAWSALMWWGSPGMTPEDPSDLLRTIEAEDAYDLSDDLPRITTPTLVAGGDRDYFYGPELFRRTAHGLPHGQLRLHRRLGHAGTTTSARVRRDVLHFLGVRRVTAGPAWPSIRRSELAS